MEGGQQSASWMETRQWAVIVIAHIVSIVDL